MFHRPPMSPRALGSLGAGLIVTCLLTACGGGTAATGSTSPTAATAVTGTTAATAPATTAAGTGTGSEPGGTPSAGPANPTAGPDGSAGAVGAVTHNDADLAFVTAMVPHHEGAVAMAMLAPDRASSPAVVELAARIAAAQQPEIDLMTGWLVTWSAEPSGAPDATTGMSGPNGHEGMSGHGGMAHPTGAGMMSADDMSALTDATGPAFDRLFLEQMTVHHRGAVDMAATEIAAGANPDAVALAVAIRDTQTAEIASMEELLAAL